MLPEFTPPELTDAQRHLLSSNLAEVRKRIAAAAARSGRDVSSVKLVAVTKYVDVRTTRALVELGCSSLGESRPQSLWQKAAELSSLPIEWHMIGHLQRNKLERTLPHLALLHSGDSLRLLEAINAACVATSQRLSVLIEVNVSGDAAKHGFAPDEVQQSLDALSKFKALDVRGLMTMAGREADADETRRQFASLRELRDRLALKQSGVAVAERTVDGHEWRLRGRDRRRRDHRACGFGAV